MLPRGNLGADRVVSLAWTQVHCVHGRGDIVVGDDVSIEGQVTITFAVQLSFMPTLEIGDRTKIAHGCVLAVGRHVSIGKDCVIAGDTIISDASGHPVEPDARRARLPPSPDHVRPVFIEDNVWIGRRAIIFPGVRIGEWSVVSAGSLVRADVPPYTLVASESAMNVARLTGPSGSRRPEA